MLWSTLARPLPHHMTNPLPPTPLSDPRGFGASLSGIRLLATDVDGTLTGDGGIPPSVWHAAKQLSDAGIEVLVVSGRPAGEVQGLVRYLPGVKRGLAENGLVEVVPDQPPRPLFPTDRTALEHDAQQFNRDTGASLRITPDNYCRLCDMTFERDGRSNPELESLRTPARKQGLHLVWSSVHVHVSRANPDKGHGVLELAAEWGMEGAEIATLGDAPNDAGLFVRERFGLTVGTADVLRHLSVLPEPPQYVTREPEAEGFCELARLLLAGRG